ncbi:hypothetical protein JS84_11055 [Vibrio vulnificus]|nr:hypothetical protein Y702_14480 [Vibrio vulnificus BAA87]KFK58119.1 hypothetical protein JS83_20405 [Vibrio vulnificus]KFK64499.1 hypothetical protein JS84_11055 [Vibrio vulnificus]KFK67087.1 hypothetical protein JS85_22085 [Vibrio vulnificus]POC43558.1 hypothetical protein CRN45_23730 [Vibrio vulnificus]
MSILILCFIDLAKKSRQRGIVMFYVSLFDSISNPLAEHTPIGKIHIKSSKDRQRKYHEIPFF